ncbi:hypothetical protein C486_02438 [Natrinema gari JCM 14663]|uniref:Uncharacterized protein n=1 Tax=Natrinema gari JCM 14663 TaxID=1230459 RepID=L9ZAZ6_9EURY|nr:hypothetical protein C486_02438 [Natrinema gari JCM 14663]
MATAAVRAPSSERNPDRTLLTQSPTTGVSISAMIAENEFITSGSARFFGPYTYLMSLEHCNDIRK